MLTKKYFKTKNEAEVTFEFSRDDVDSVELLGEFTDWQPVEMKFNKKSNVFRAKLRLPVGESFHFRYLLNGEEWENDYNADQYMPNVYGSDNSVVHTYN
ncbi:isoamylase early set domain-containing protein [Thalassotalea euphylliae]|uniref:isoamylase early set domain-containing protein n=1 Tax=Thalassotalea euphylliae TaxID=1655234 RepID=UPI003638A606